MPATYEGYVRYEDGSVVSAQCAEGRHGECPDDTEPGTERDGGGPLEGYYCVCPGCDSCGYVPVRQGGLFTDADGNFHTPEAERAYRQMHGGTPD